MTDWTFDNFGTEFDTHVAQHLPGYDDVQRLVGTVSQYLVPAGGVVADFGASTGRTAHEISEAIPSRDVKFHLYDSDKTMLLEAQKRVPKAHTHLGNFPESGLQHEDADLSLALWFLQFVHPKRHVSILREIRRGTLPGGALIVATKSIHLDSRWQEIAVGELDDHKGSRGVSSDERVQKTKALRGTMFPVELETLISNIVEAGWGRPTILYRWHVWTVLGAFNDERYL